MNGRIRMVKFQDVKGKKKGMKRRKLEEDVGEVMQIEVQNMLGGLLRE